MSNVEFPFAAALEMICPGSPPLPGLERVVPL